MAHTTPMANAIRALAMDAVQQANSGHPGAPMGMADIAVALWGEHLRHNPRNPHWPDRDRFVLSNGHGSMLIYSLLHLSGYDLSIEDLKSFRQLHSITPGHPELHETPGVEATTGPLGQGVRSMDILAFMRWNLPSLLQTFPNFPERILIVSAGDPMWRGGISGPNSLFLHADRPLISGNGTSTLLHELMHIAQGYSAEGGDDWIVEGIAEYYTLEILHRSGTLSSSRYEKGHEKLDAWGEEVQSMESEHSSGARTARAVSILQDLDAELRANSKGIYSLDDVARRLSVDGNPVTLSRLRQVCEDLVGKPLASLSDAKVEGR